MDKKVRITIEFVSKEHPGYFRRPIGSQVRWIKTDIKDRLKEVQEEYGQKFVKIKIHSKISPYKKPDNSTKTYEFFTTKYSKIIQAKTFDEAIKLFRSFDLSGKIIAAVEQDADVKLSKGDK